MRNGIVVVFFVILASSGFAWDDGGVIASGHFRTDVGILFAISNSHLENYYYFGKNTLRVDVVNSDTAYGKIDGSVDLHIVSGRYYDIFFLQTNGILLGDNVLLLINLRKLYLAVSLDWVDISIGRQLLRFGQGLVFSPINFFDKLDISDINFSRIGSDSIRLKAYLSDTSDANLIVVPRTQVTNSDFSARLSFMLAGINMEGAIGYFGQNEEVRAGLSFKADVEVGIYGEFAYNYHNQETNRYFEFVIGGDYSIFKKLVVRGEYYFNSLDVAKLPLQSAISLRNYPFVSKQYAMLQLSYLPDITTTATLSIIKNLEKDGFILYAGITKSMFQNVNFYFDTKFFYRDISGIFQTNYNFLHSSLGFEIKY
ncbi:MAG: hypothetical protein ABDH28_03700 [Brevinematia bacterium]